MTQSHPKSILLLSGLSGAGKTTALKTLEDMGWEVVDNLPLVLLDRLLDTPLPAGHAGADDRPLALGIDARTRGFDANAIVQRIKALRDNHGHDVETLFLDCSGTELERRFAETRRRHPLALDRPAADGIARERELTEPLRRWASQVIDTTSFSSNALQQAIRDRFSRERLSDPVLTILSFGFSRGMPRNADLMFDMRFLRNPHWDDALRDKTGQDADVAAYIMADPAYEEAVGKIEELLKIVLPRYAEAGKAYITVAFGCTGGRHRSVHVAERVARYLQDAGFSPTVSHRNMESAPQDSLEKRPPGGPKAIS
ncbi:MAG: RNase adapter RapZ [Sphingobium sp.]|uniref:RNase adapter RapZ n=1 Tax=Sphingobium xenophagum TaxID=121428 RepID=A0A249MTC9_SPHXE|nr:MULTISPECIES: RNase adapter RapZ [Sphingobium]MBU0659584.1 RNase adapter RapZ [Alphaproteobacteria bacterium]ASY44621.1 RNase adapter RapZ [Sphingobium xenophagum]MBA4754031.1 RNase adapter RapZ [Sphingobium sp.]MBS89162.1 RNase adapter RapZ [Sphingobium sp.]MBU0775909.1 RNase adapter RapZ [Alphaproteobacteria bacterium]|tara:strand:+ start:1369 stop:2307 length:939 start_codon:yes stop_codon:yes gene_type:complete